MHVQVRQCIVAEPIITAADFHNTLEVLQKLVVPQVPSNMAATLQQLIDQARRMSQYALAMFLQNIRALVKQMCMSRWGSYSYHSDLFDSVPVHKLNESGDPPALRAQISQLFDEWIGLSDNFKKDEAYDAFVSRLQHLGFLKASSSIGFSARMTVSELWRANNLVRAMCRVTR